MASFRTGSLENMQGFNFSRPTKAQLLSGESISLLEKDDESFGKAIRIKNMDIEDIDFIDPNLWKASDQCHVCDVVIESYNNCRICGHAVCDICFRKRINDKKLIEAKKHQVQQIKQKLEEVNEQISSEKKELHILDHRNENDRAILEEMDQKNAEIKELKEQIQARKQKYEEKIQVVEYLQKELSNEFDSMNNLQAQETSLQTEIQQKQSTFGIKDENFKCLTKQQKKILNSKSYQKYQRMESEIISQRQTEILEDEQIRKTSQQLENKIQKDQQNQMNSQQEKYRNNEKEHSKRGYGNINNNLGESMASEKTDTGEEKLVVSDIEKPCCKCSIF